MQHVLIKYAHVFICISAGEGSRHFSAFIAMVTVPASTLLVCYSHFIFYSASLLIIIAEWNHEYSGTRLMNHVLLPPYCHYWCEPVGNPQAMI